MNDQTENEKRQQQMGRIVAKCWADEEFKKRLLADTAGTLRAEGIEVPEGITINAVENSEQNYTIVIPPKPGESELTDDELDGVAGGGFSIPYPCFGELLCK